MRDESTYKSYQGSNRKYQENDFIQISFQEKMIMLEFRDEDKQFIISILFSVLSSWQVMCFNKRIYFWARSEVSAFDLYDSIHIYLLTILTFSVSNSIPSLPIIIALVDIFLIAFKIQQIYQTWFPFREIARNYGSC